MSSVNKRQGRTHFSKQEKWTKGRGNREKTDKERVSLSLILIEYHKCTRNKRGQGNENSSFVHAEQATYLSRSRRHARTRDKISRAHTRTTRTRLYTQTVNLFHVPLDNEPLAYAVVGICGRRATRADLQKA